MGFQIVWSESAERAIKKLPRPISKRIFEKIGLLSGNPQHYLERLVGQPYYKLRIGDYRAIVDIQYAYIRILVIKVGHRKDIYD